MRTSRLEAFSDGVLAAASTSKRRWGRDLKGKLSPALYLIGIEVSFVEPWLELIPYVLVALLWLVPDRRVERWLADHETMRSTADLRRPARRQA